MLFHGQIVTCIMFGLSISKDGDIDNLDEGVGETDTETLWRPFVIKFKRLYGQHKLIYKLYTYLI